MPKFIFSPRRSCLQHILLRGNMKIFSAFFYIPIIHMKIFLNHRQMQQCLIHPSLGDPICLTANTVIDVDDMLAYRMMFFTEIILAVSLEQRRQLFHKQIFHCLSQFIPLFNRNFPLERYSSAKIQISPFSSLVNNILLAFSLNYLVKNVNQILIFNHNFYFTSVLILTLASDFILL